MHPVLFYLHTPWGDHPVYSYGVMLGLSVILGWYGVHRTARRLGIEETTMEDVYAASIVCALIGARISFILANRAEFASVGDMFSPSHGGLLAPGAWLAGGLALVVLAKRRGELPLRLADAATPALALALGLTRIGCYLYGCDYGTRLGAHAPSFLAWLGRFPRITDVRDSDVIVGSPAFVDQMTHSASGLGLDARYALPVHPTQLYEALLGFSVLAISVGILVFARRRDRTLVPGDVFLPSALVYGLVRIAIEPLRGDGERGFIGPLSVPLITTIVLLLAVSAIGIGRYVRANRRPSAPA